MFDWMAGSEAWVALISLTALEIVLGIDNIIFISILVGRYADAVAANEQAVQADNAYIAQCHAQGLYPVAYVPHNHHFLAAAASFIGDKEKAFAASLHVRDRQDTKLMRQPGYATLQHYWSMPYFAWVRFGQWDALLPEPAPAEDLIYPNGIWNYARGLARIRTGDLDGAAASLRRLTAIADDPEMAVTRLWEINTMAQVLGIAREVLSGELALARGPSVEAIQHLSSRLSSHTVGSPSRAISVSSSGSPQWMRMLSTREVAVKTATM